MDVASGTTPPHVFLPLRGRLLFIGPTLVSLEDPRLFIDPKLWLSMTSAQVMAIRMRSMSLMRPADPVKGASDPVNERLQEIAIRDGSVDVEVGYRRRGYFRVTDLLAEPVRRAGDLERVIYYSGGRSSRLIEEAYYSRDLKASSAILKLYKGGIGEQKIQQLLSVGALGVQRKLVATRWSITATDSTISQSLLGQVREMQELDTPYIGFFEALSNRFAVVLLPGRLYYEFLESWGPYYGDPCPRVAVDHEGFLGRTDYAEETEGAYYAARLAVAERLVEMKRQARAIVFMEVDRGWIPSLGVWRVREGVREALRRLERADSEASALEQAMGRMKTCRRSWVDSSFSLRQRSLTEFM